MWLYHRFPLSFREVEELMLVRGVIVTYETIRQWCAKFGPVYAAGLRRRQPRPGDTWHLDEVFLTINGRRQYLWRAVDQDGNVSTSWSNLAGMPRPPSGSYANSSRGSARLLGCWSPTSSEAIRWRICQRSFGNPAARTGFLRVGGQELFGLGARRLVVRGVAGHWES